jgi:O-antigen/teichoic acid export membrane protein
MTAKVMSLDGAGREIDRARRRLRRAGATSLTTLAARAASFGSFLLLVPLTLPYLGKEGYGVWMTLLSLAALFSVTNLGIGNALVTLIARTDAEGNEREAGRYVSTAVMLFTGISLVLAIVAVATFPIIPWASVFNLPNGPAATEAGRAAAALATVYLVGIPIGIVTQVRLGYQEGYTNAAWDIAGSVLTVAAAGLVVALRGSLPMLVAAVAAAPLFSSVGNVVFILRKRPALRPRLRNAGRRQARVLLRFGGLYLVLQLAVIVGYSSDNFVAAQVLGPESVTQYAVPSRLALAGIGLTAVFVMPLWPAYAESLARNDTAWTLRTFRRSLVASTTVGAVGAGLFVAFGGPIVRALSRGLVNPSWLLLIGLGAWLVLGSAGNAFAAFLNAAHVVRLQVICATVMAVTNIIASIALARSIGVSGLIWGTVASYTICVVIPYSVLVPRVMRRVRLARTGAREAEQ